MTIAVTQPTIAQAAYDYLSEHGSALVGDIAAAIGRDHPTVANALRKKKRTFACVESDQGGMAVRAKLWYVIEGQPRPAGGRPTAKQQPVASVRRGRSTGRTEPRRVQAAPAPVKGRYDRHKRIRAMMRRGIAYDTAWQVAEAIDGGVR